MFTSFFYPIWVKLPQLCSHLFYTSIHTTNSGDYHACRELILNVYGQRYIEKLSEQFDQEANINNTGAIKVWVIVLMP